MMQENSPLLWKHLLPRRAPEGHKYHAGQVAVLGGVEMPGAACLAADAAMRSGAGIVTIISPQIRWRSFSAVEDPIHVYRSYRPYLIARKDIGLAAFLQNSVGKGRACAVMGPGLGLKEAATVRRIVLQVLALRCPAVLDADALNAFADDPIMLLSGLHENVVLTPHQGEFARIFPDLAASGSRADHVVQAARAARCTVLLKGSRTLVASHGRDGFTENRNAPPSLATAGSGDVLAGVIAGLMAQGTPTHEAACAGCWIHGDAASRSHVHGLVATDIIDQLPHTISALLAAGGRLH